MEAHGIRPIDLLVVNLYPFEATVAKGADYETCIENITLADPRLIRAAAKNHADVAVIVDADDYAPLLAELDAHTAPLRSRCQEARRKAYGRTAAYDAAISNWFAAALADPAPTYRTIGGKLAEALRLRREPAPVSRLLPHRRDALRRRDLPPGAGQGALLHNVNDTDAPMNASQSSTPSATAACTIIKHANPCGSPRVPRSSSLSQGTRLRSGIRLRRHRGAEPAARRRGRARHHRDLYRGDQRTRRHRGGDQHRRRQEEPAAAPCRWTPQPARARPPGQIGAGGMLVSSRDNAVVRHMLLNVVTKRSPTNAERAISRLRSGSSSTSSRNAIVYAKDSATVGIGAGQMSRVDSARIAARKALDAAQAAGTTEPATKSSVVASDAFFPFAMACWLRSRRAPPLLIQPGGSMRDDEVIKAADDHNIAMVFTGTRHFRH